jgi:hypothetical protein
MSVEKIKAGPARSVREISAYLSGRPCPKCGGPLRNKWGEVTDAGAVMRMYSKKCDSEFDYAFEPGPGWKSRPPEDDPRYGSTDDPSAIVPEEKFREIVTLHVERVREREAEGAPKGVDADEVARYRDMMQADAIEAFGALLELDKLARAGNRKLEPELAKLDPWLRKYVGPLRGS